ncbi:MAG: GIY-YIG nuclease family protein [Planctomycetaceae bacterium]
MDMNHLLKEAAVDPETSLVLRHRPKEPELRRVLPWLVEERHAVFNAYQQTQSPRTERQMRRATHVVSLIGDQPGRGVFVGIYRMGKPPRNTSRADRKRIPAHCELEKYGHPDHPGQQLWFDLERMEAFSHWIGKLIVGWPPPEISWSRWSGRNTFDIVAILEESLFCQHMPDWKSLVLSWNDLQVMPTTWKAALSQWLGVYFILDISDGRGYVGSAYGKDNIFGRWGNYRRTGHGGNKLLRSRNPENLRFSILERLSPDTPPDEVIRRETTWKLRLHTQTQGLNDN